MNPLRIPFFWDVTLSHRVTGSRRFDATQCHHLQESKRPTRTDRDKYRRRTESIATPLRKPQNSQSTEWFEGLNIRLDR